LNYVYKLFVDNSITFQGEIIDLYLKDDQKSMILISSFMQLAAMVSTIMGTELYASSGWVSVGFGVASFNILPLVILPFLKNIKVQESVQQKVETVDPAVRSKGLQSVSQWSRRIAYYIPEVVLFLNNMVVELVVYVLPPRIVQSTTMSITSAVSLLRILGIASFLSALTLSFIAGKFQKFNVLGVMAAGNVSYYCGAAVAYGATTYHFRFLGVTHQLIIGLIFMGLGGACHLNLCIPSKFYLHEKWNLNKDCLGQQAAKIYNIVISLSSMLGTVMSALSLTCKSEVPTVAGMSGLGVVLTVGLLLCYLVK